MHKDRETGRKKRATIRCGSWKLDGQVTTYLIDPRKEYGSITRKTSTLVYTGHWQKVWELEAMAVSGRASEVRRASNKEDWMKAVLCRTTRSPPQIGSSHPQLGKRLKSFSGVFFQKNKESLDYGIQGKFKAGMNHNENIVRSEHGHTGFETSAHMYHLVLQNGARLFPPRLDSSRGWGI